MTEKVFNLGKNGYNIIKRSISTTCLQNIKNECGLELGRAVRQKQPHGSDNHYVLVDINNSKINSTATHQPEITEQGKIVPTAVLSSQKDLCNQPSNDPEIAPQYHFYRENYDIKIKPLSPAIVAKLDDRNFLDGVMYLSYKKIRNTKNCGIT